MTYQHSLRYLTERDTATSYLPLEPLRNLLTLIGTPPIVICISHDKCGRTAARMLRDILQSASLCCLHVIDSDRVEARDRFMLDDRRIAPDLLCHSTTAIRDLEIRLRRTTNDKGAETFLPSYRTALTLLRCLSDVKCHVLLVECDGISPWLRAMNDLFPTPPVCITLVSPTDDGGRCALSTVPFTTHSVISHACGQPLYRTLSDACARAGNLPLRIIPTTGLNRTSVTLGSQCLEGPFPRGCRIGSGTTLAAKAAVLSLYAVNTLRDLHLTITDTAITSGLSRTAPIGCAKLVSIHPRLVIDRVDNTAELIAAMADLEQLEDSLPRPRRVWLEDTLIAAFAPFRAFADELYTQGEPYVADAGTTTFFIGSADFLDQSGNTQEKD